MGVKNLWEILDSCKKTLPLSHLENKRLCVDLSCWIVQLHTACKSPVCLRDKVYLRNLFHRLRALIALNCTLIFVSDGSIPALKLSTYRRRLGASSEAIPDDANSNAVSSLKRNMGSVFSRMIKEAKVLGMALGIPCLDGLEEAEAQCALLDFSNLCDGCFSGDSDIFLFGARTIYKDIVLGDGGHVFCYEMVDIERKLGFGRNSLITLAILLGSDYSQGVRGFGSENSCQIVKSLGETTILQQVTSAGFKFEKTTKQNKKKGKDSKSNEQRKQHVQDTSFTISENSCYSGTNSQFIPVIEAYLNPKCHLDDSEVVSRACSQHSFQRDSLHQLCSQYFGWEPEKTDQYILPKIAERDLRRFGNLRATSSLAGVQISLEKMPVSCPVSSIVKQRKANGSEYFEVSWQGIDGLKTSSVPAHLIQSACPERITEFLEARIQKKEKRKPRQKKSNKAIVHDVDLQLQGLILSIETESSKSNLASLTTNNAETEVIDLMSPCPVINSSVVTSNADADVINLLSPSPNIRARKIPKHHENIGKYIDAITLDMDNNEVGKEEEDLSQVINTENTHEVSSSLPSNDLINIIDSDIDESPEHQKKARELRLFINSIKGDLY